MRKHYPIAAGSRKIYRKQKMGFVLIHIAYFFLEPQDVVVFILPLFHLTKSSLRCVAVFFFFQTESYALAQSPKKQKYKKFDLMAFYRYNGRPPA